MTTVLLVEDDQLVRETMVKVLRRAEVNLLAACSAREALSLAAEHDGIDVLVSDVRMPGMSGVELARQIRDTQKDLRIIFTSGEFAETALDGCEFADEVVFLHKPFSPSELVRAIRDETEQY